MRFAPQQRALFSTLFRHLNLQKWSEHGVFCTFLTSKCASRHNGVHFFDIATSKSGPRLRCFCTFWLQNVLRATTACTFSTSQLPKSGPALRYFVHFDFKMCFAPHRRALFRHRNFQKWSAPLVFWPFLTWKCASRHNGVHFFMSHLASWLRTRRFSEPTFRPSGATNHWKNTVNRDFPIFSRIYLFFLLIFSLLTLLTSAFQLSILSEVSLLNFLR